MNELFMSVFMYGLIYFSDYFEDTGMSAHVLFTSSPCVCAVLYILLSVPSGTQWPTLVKS